MAIGYEHDHKVLNWCHKMRSEGFPRHYGLFLNNIIFRVHCDGVYEVDHLWWDLYVKYCRRDQMFLPYALWIHPEVKVDYLFSQGEHTFNTDCINQCRRKKGLLSKRRYVEQGVFEHARSRLRYGYWEKTKKFQDYHYWLYGLPRFLAHIFLDLWGGYVVMMFGPIVKIRAAINKRKL